MSDTLARGGGWKTEPDKNKENVYVGLIINDEHCIITWLRTLLTPLQDKRPYPYSQVQPCRTILSHACQQEIVPEVMRSS